MVEYVGQKMVVDMRVADGNVAFEKDQFIWRARGTDNKLVIKYEDIDEIQIVNQDTKKDVRITLKNGRKYDFFLYKAATFIELINAGIEAMKTINAGGTAPISDDDLDRLTKLVELHKNQVLTDEQFEHQKKLIMDKYQ